MWLLQFEELYGKFRDLSEISRGKGGHFEHGVEIEGPSSSYGP